MKTKKVKPLSNYLEWHYPKATKDFLEWYAKINYYPFRENSTVQYLYDIIRYKYALDTKVLIEDVNYKEVGITSYRFKQITNSCEQYSDYYERVIDEYFDFQEQLIKDYFNYLEHNLY